MADSEDDYMSDKLLIGCDIDDVRPGLLYNKSQKRKHELYKKQQEERVKKPKSYQEQEKETRDKGLSTAISSENKGFKLLEKMGYKAGTGLGKSVRGITEPVTIKPKDNSAGVGREAHLKDVVQQNLQLKKQSLEAKEQEFRNLNSQRHYWATLERDYKKAQRTCEELDLQSGIQSPQLPFFWSKESREALNKKAKEDAEEENEKEEEAVAQEEVAIKDVVAVESDDEVAAEEEEEVEDEITEPKLCDMIMYLRRQYLYCIYCGDYIEQGALSSCPGYFRKEHDE